MIKVEVSSHVVEEGGLGYLLENLHPPLYLGELGPKDEISQTQIIYVNSPFLPDDEENTYKLWITRTKYDTAKREFHTWKAEKVDYDGNSQRETPED